MRAAGVLAAAMLLSGCNAVPSPLGGPAPASLCDVGRPHLDALRSGTGAIYGADVVTQDTIDRLADALMAVHDALEGTEWDDLAIRARESVAQADAVAPTATATGKMEVISWSIAAAGLHDQIAQDCEEPEQDAARQRRQEFLEVED